jgi:hypothetical protein
MPNVNPLFQNLSLDPAEMITVNEAYDLACQTLQNIGQLEVDREIIARGILRGAKSGDPRAMLQRSEARRTDNRRCQSSSTARLCLSNHPALSRAFHAKRRSTANCELLSFHCS